MKELDEIVKCHPKIMGHDDLSILKTIQSGAMQTRETLYRNGEVQDKLCKSCGGEHTARHVLRECPQHDDTRKKCDKDLVLLFD